MKRTVHYLILLLAIACMAACSSSKPETKQGVVMLEKVWDAEGSIMLSDIATSIDYIPLELTDNEASVLPSSNRISVKMTRDFFLIYSRESVIKQYSTDGKFVRNLGSLGKGPGEYTMVGKLLLTNDEEQIWVFDNGQHKMILYNNDGTFIKEFAIPNRSAQVTIDTKNNLYVMVLEYDRSLMDSCKIMVLNKDGVDIDQISLYKNRRLGAGSSWRIYYRFTFNNGALEDFEPPYDTLFRYESGSWHPIWVLNPGSNALPFEAYTENKFNEIFKPYSFVSSLLETSNYFFLNGVNHQKMKKILVDKTTSTAKPCDYSTDKVERSWPFKGLTNDLDGGVPFWPRSSYKYNYLLTLIDPTDLMAFEPAFTDASLVADKDRSKLEQLMKSLNPEGNPIVMKVKLK